ncbi:MAG: radical SAM/SPASM domain-containing protein [Bacteroidales bacterium]
MPPTVGVEITNKCNLRCPECPTGSGQIKREQGFMTLELFGKLIEELKSKLLNINLYFQGEPMLHPEFFSFVSLVRGIPVTISTNGHYLTDENIKNIVSSDLRRLIVSLDGIDQQTYTEYRKGGDINRVTEGIKKLSSVINEKRSTIKLEIQFLVNRHNEHQIAEVRKFAIETGAKFHLKSMQIITSDGFEKWLPFKEKYRRYYKDKTGYRLKSSLKNSCFRLWMNPVITWNGDVLPCCFDKDTRYVLGNITRSSFWEIWHGSNNREFRNRLLSHRAGIDICRNCTTGLKGVVV